MICFLLLLGGPLRLAKHFATKTNAVGWAFMLQKILIALSLMAVAAFCSACDPCRSLAEYICQCNVYPPDQQSCLAKLDQYSNHPDFSTAENGARCQAILDETDPAKQCTCLALNQDGRYDLCGITRPAASQTGTSQ